MRVWEPNCCCKTTQLYYRSLRAAVGTPRSLCPGTQRNKGSYGGETDSVCSLRSLTWA